MKPNGKVFFITGGASGLGEATVRYFTALDNKAAIIDMSEDRGQAITHELGDQTIFVKTDVTSETDMQAAVDATMEKFGRIDVLVACAGIGSGTKVFGKKGPHPLEAFNKVLQINVVGTFNAIRLVVEQMSKNEPNEEGERGVLITTSSTAAWEGQIGQTAYAASKGAINGMVLPIARELASLGVRIVSIAPGTMATPALLALPEKVQEGLAKMVPFPSRLGRPEEFAHLIGCVLENCMLNGTVIRQDAALRMQA